MKNKKVLAFFFLFVIPSLTTQAYWVWSPESGKFVNPEGVVEDSAEEQYEYAMKLYREQDYDGAIKQLEELVKHYRTSEVAPEAQYRLGIVYEEKSEYLKAYGAFKKLIESFPQSERIAEVVEREFRIGNLFLSGRKAKLMGLEILPSLPKAAEIFQHIIDNAPYSKYGDQAQFRLGLTHKKSAKFGEAVDAFQALLDNYPQSELIAEARFQLAETAYLRSNASIRDQRALEDASQEVDRFLARYPDSAATEKAAKLRGEISEKSAEKNYRIAAYYEKTNYLKSALIYYREVANRFPQTQWGHKAAVKLKTIEAPATYLTEQTTQVAGEIQAVEAELAAVAEDDAIEKDRLKRQIERLGNRQRTIEKSKKESIQSRREDLKRRQSELKEKFKKLEKKRKLLKDNSSEDLKRAMDRWHTSLEAEQAELLSEERQIKGWGSALGLKSPGLRWDVLPFVGEGSTELDKVRDFEAKKLFKAADDKRDLLDEKELLYRQRGEIVASLDELETKRLGLDAEDERLIALTGAGQDTLRQRRDELAAVRAEIERLEKELAEKRTAYERQFREAAWFSWAGLPGQVAKTSAQAVGASFEKSFEYLNPFSHSSSDFRELDIQELTEMRMHLREKIQAQRSVVNTLNRAFDQEFALEEQKRLLASLETDENVDARAIRKTVKQLQKQIRSRYEEIDDRHRQKQHLVEEVAVLIKTKESQAGLVARTGKIIALPATTFARLGHAFIFGRKADDVQVTEAVNAMKGEEGLSKQARELRDEIELQSLMIEARNWEINQLQRELEIAQAQASLAGGYKFRSSLVSVPYLFLTDALDGAKRIVPQKDRPEILFNRLEKETNSLERDKAEAARLDEVILEKTGGRALPVETVPVPEPVVDAVTAEEGADESALRAEIENLSETIEATQERYEQEKKVVADELRALAEEADGGKAGKQIVKESKKARKQEDKLREELQGIEEEILSLISKEKNVEDTETSILQRRIERIDHAVEKVTSQALTQDLLSERGRMQERLIQIESRQNFLSKETDRFKLTQTESLNS